MAVISIGDGDDDDDPRLSVTVSTNTTPTLMSTSNEYLPLTTIFTPDPSCASFYVANCVFDRPNPGSCYANAFPKAGCLDVSGQSTIRSSLSCYPGAIQGNFPPTYSPGYSCPLGMTTVESVPLPNGAWCCPNGLTWADRLCQKTTSSAKLISTDSNSCMVEKIITVSRLIDGDGAIVLSAAPVRLIGKDLFDVTSSLPSPSSSTTISPISLLPTSGPKGVPTIQHSPSKTAEVGIILGSILGAILLSLFAAYYIWRLRRARLVKKAQPEEAVKVDSDEYTGKAELEGSKAYVYTIKPELDATAIRAELEGDLGEPHDDGIYLLKPELQGTVGTERNRGAFVRKRSELEATSKTSTSTTQRNLAELEAMSSSEGNGLMPSEDQIAG